MALASLGGLYAWTPAFQWVTRGAGWPAMGEGWLCGLFVSWREAARKGRSVAHGHSYACRALSGLMQDALTVRLMMMVVVDDSKLEM